MIKKVIILGPAYPYRGGGITTFNERMATEFQNMGYDVSICNFTLLYPTFLFPGKTQFSTLSAPANLKIVRKINSINPFNWIAVGNELKKIKPDLILVRYWLPLMAPALGTILRKIKKNQHTKVIALADNIVPHEKRLGDKSFTRYFLKPCDAVVTMSEKVLQDLNRIDPLKPAIRVAHPLYDNFGDPVSKDTARNKLGIPGDALILLFFGFIRKYKGLDILLEAMALLNKEPGPFNMIKLVVAGEFYEDEKKYHRQIDELDIQDMVILRTAFIPDNDVKYYFGAADAVVQPYRSATQSGVTPLAYHFEKPLIVTNVGGLGDYVPHEKVGLVSDPTPAALAAAIKRYFTLGEDYFLPHLREEKRKYSWKEMVNQIIKLTESLGGK